MEKLHLRIYVSLSRLPVNCWPTPIQIIRGAVQAYHANLYRAALQKRTTRRPFRYFSSPHNHAITPPVRRFEYPSRLDGRSIRLIYLERVQPGEAIRMRIFQTEFDTAPPYLALSYVWGDAKDTCNILCNNSSFAITRNLHAVLRKLMEQAIVLEPQKQLENEEPELDEDLILWVDAICINQADNKEKSEQVKLMFDIYRQAYGVVAWLGKGNSTTTAAISFCFQMAGITLDSMKKEEELGSQYFDRSDTDLSAFYRESGIWDGLLDVLSRSWFSRVWIIQEFIAAKTCYFICGDMIFDAPKFLFITRGIFSSVYSRDHLFHEKKGPNFWSNLEALGYLSSKPKQYTLIDLLYLTRSFQATDVRDKVFAVAHLSNDAPKDLVDYHLNSSDVFRKVIDLALGQGNPDTLSTIWPLRGLYGLPGLAPPQFLRLEGEILPLSATFHSSSSLRSIQCSQTTFWETNQVSGEFTLRLYPQWLTIS